MVLSEGSVTKLSLPLIKTAYLIAAPATIVFSLTCFLVSRMTLLTSLFLVFALTTLSGLVSLTFHDSVHPAQSSLMGTAASVFALLFDSLIVKIRSR